MLGVAGLTPQDLNFLLSQALFALMKATDGRSRQSAMLIKEAVLKFYSDNNLFPAGIVAELECVQSWAERIGRALKKMVLWLKLRCHSAYFSTLFYGCML